MIKTTYNPHLEKYMQDERNYIKARGASEERSNQEGFSPLRAYALVQRISSGGELSPELEQLIQSVDNCKGQNYENFVKAHSASIVRAVQAQNAAEQNKGSNFMKHYKLVNKINGVEID